jgi:hypothetical protein
MDLYMRDVGKEVELFILTSKKRFHLRKDRNTRTGLDGMCQDE